MSNFDKQNSSIWKQAEVEAFSRRNKKRKENGSKELLNMTVSNMKGYFRDDSLTQDRGSSSVTNSVQ